MMFSSPKECLQRVSGKHGNKTYDFKNLNLKLRN